MDKLKEFLKENPYRKGLEVTIKNLTPSTKPTVLYEQQITEPVIKLKPLHENVFEKEIQRAKSDLHRMVMEKAEAEIFEFLKETGQIEIRNELARTGEREVVFINPTIKPLSWIEVEERRLEDKWVILLSKTVPLGECAFVVDAGKKNKILEQETIEEPPNQ